MKSLRMNAALKYGEVKHKAVLADIVKRFANELQKIEFIDGKIAIILENPVEKHEFKHAIKAGGGIIEYGINREMLIISPLALFELVISVSENREQDLKKIVQAQIKSKEKQAAIFNSTLTLRQKINKIGEEINDKAGLANLLLLGAKLLLV